MLRIGIDKLLDETEQMDYAKIDFNAMLGHTDKNGHWLEIPEKPTAQDETDEVPEEKPKDNNMYMFEGVDYRSAAQKPDIDLFDRLILHESHAAASATSSSERRVSERPVRRPMSEEEKLARTAKMLETKARRKQEMVGVHQTISGLVTAALHFRKKQNDNVNKEEKLDCNNYGQRRTIVRVASRCRTTKMISWMKQLYQTLKVHLMMLINSED